MFILRDLQAKNHSKFVSNGAKEIAVTDYVSFAGQVLQCGSGSETVLPIAGRGHELVSAEDCCAWTGVWIEAMNASANRNRNDFFGFKAWPGESSPMCSFARECALLMNGVLNL